MNNGLNQITTAAIALINSLINIDKNANGKADAMEVMGAIIKNLQSTPLIMGAIPDLKEEFKNGFDISKAAKIIKSIQEGLQGIDVKQKSWLEPVNKTLAVLESVLFCVEAWITYEKNKSKITEG